MTLFLSRASLRRDAGLDALLPLLLPSEDGKRIGVAHRLVWSLFAGDADRDRDFLWHEEAPGVFLVLSPDRPSDPRGLFEVESKPFAPRLSAGDRLAFFLRANPVVTTAKPDPAGRRRHDVVMAAIKAVSKPGRAAARTAALGWSDDGTEAGTNARLSAPVAWLARRGERSGFSLDAAVALAYRPVRIPRDAAPGRARDDIRFSAVDLEGQLTVRDPDAFLGALRAGFGKAKAFGCGLMLIRRP